MSSRKVFQWERESQVSNTSLATLKQEVERSVDAGTFITPKHNAFDMTRLLANNDNVTKNGRTVLSGELSDPVQLKSFVQGDDYYAFEFYNTTHNSPCYVLKPKPGAISGPPASGVPARTDKPNQPKPLMIVPSGQQQGLHGFGEEAQTIESQLSSGTIVFRGQLK